MTNILDAYGRDIRAGRPVDALTREIGSSPAHAMHPSYPSRGLTPERLAEIFAEADAGHVARQAELYEEMEEKDAHLGAVLQTRKLAVAGLDLEISPASASEQDAETAGFVREAFQRIEGLPGSLLDLLDAIAKGFSVAEAVWAVEGGRAWITGLRWMHQARFTFMQHDGTASETPRLLTEAEPLYGEALAPARFVVHRHRGRSTSTVRAGVMRPCAWMYLFKNYTLKDWAVFGERYAQPMRVGKFSPGASEADRAVLKEAVFNLGSDAAAIISESTVIELLETAGRGSSAEVYERFAAFCDRAVSKAVLGQTLTTEQQGGAYATARVHDAVRRDLLEADSLALAYTLREGVAAPLVAFNFGPGRAVPRVSFRHEERADLGELARTYQSLAAMGVEVPDSFIRERFGIPEPNKSEDAAADA